ncbi:glycosyltransferase [Arthrobacter sp. Soil763]|uniref:glycosyltransferase n=1 Tax=Arthrobacter sp. Soil763 TaxID=1736402 RepID=UPI0006F3B4B0|nr:glycosyltransferase [Arthrobacter sp. Soil763]KRE81583.1 glycosyl transferase family 1 [Arthrobacter sp. Soil763]
MEAPGVRLLVPGNVRHTSGGNAYNAALLRALAQLGVATETLPVDGGWPVGGPADRGALRRLLTASDAGRVTLVDGLVACGAPEELEAAAAAGTPAWILLHMPLAAHPDLERRALRAAAGVICTSNTAAAALRTAHGLRDADGGIHVAVPGTDPAAPAAGSAPPHLLVLAALLPNKDQQLLLSALAQLTDLDWTATLAGSDTADPGYAARLRRQAGRPGLAERVRIPGELRGAALDAEWSAADLSLLVSRSETYGLVVTESLARGVPVIVRDGTGAVEALAAGTPGTSVDTSTAAAPAVPGAAVDLREDPAPLAALLRRWLTDPALRAAWRAAAHAARGRLPGWDATARAVLDILGRPAGPRQRPGLPPHTAN